MTEEKDFKRVVRRRMAKTGESYTAARSRVRPAASSLKGLYERTALDDLGAHLETAYGIGVRKLTELDLGVFRVDRVGGSPWVARVFPQARSMEQVETDAEILRWLEATGFPAERLACDAPVSKLAGQGVLVTEYLHGAGARHDTSGPTMLAMGSLVGRLHSLEAESPALARRSGGWHHVVPNGGGVREAAAALLPLVADAGDGEDVRFVSRQLEHVDGSDDLPHAFIHPDACGANAVVTKDGPMLFDWAGSGRGPRVLGLASLLAGSLHPAPGVPPSRVLQPIDAIIAGYRRHVALTDDEVARLPGAICGGWFVLGAWMALFRDVPMAEVAKGIADRLTFSARVAERVRVALTRDDDDLTGWFAEPKRVVHPNQGSLF